MVDGRPADIAAAAGGVYVLTLVAVPLIDPSIDVLRAHPEDYAGGPGRALVLGGYVAVAVMAVSLAALLVSAGLRERIAAVMLVAGAVTAIAVVLEPVPVTGGPLLLGVFGLALAPLLVALGRERPARIRVLGAAVTLCFLGLLFAPAAVNGLANRVFDVALGVWGTAYALTVRSGRQSFR